MWSSRTEQLANGRVIKVAIDLDVSSVSYAEVLRRWRDDAEFRSFFSTAGAGVAWLHVRLDDRPKYYGYPPYRRDV
jgi:Family of unknown function (DUF6940)